MKGASSIQLQCDHDTGLSIWYYNARSLLPKLDELHATALSQKPDLICIVETWLSDDVIDNELLLSGYQQFRLDRNRHGGGVIIYVCSSLLCKVLVKGGPFSLEFLALSVSIASNKFCILFFTVLHLHPFLFLIIFVSHCR